MNGREKPETGQVPISDQAIDLPISAIRPATVNSKVYRPIDPNAPDIIDLAKSIKRSGLQHPIGVTEDRVIYSGHRRFAAHLLLERPTVRCIVRKGLFSDSPEFLPLLVECNKQRSKGLDEIAREEAILADPKEARRVLTALREEKARLQIDPFEIEGVMHRAEITKAKAPMIQAIFGIIESHQRWLPITVRRVHYAMLDICPLRHASKPDFFYSNDAKSYKDLSNLLTRARIAGLIPWEVIVDETRPVELWNFHKNATSFIRQEFRGLLTGYYRDLMQSQPNHIEIVAEKNTVEGIVRRVAGNYTIPFIIERGQCSSPPRQQLAKRFRASGKAKLVLLILGDFDPDGQEIINTFPKSMRDDFGIHQVHPIKVALSQEQVEHLDLPGDFEAKTTSTNYRKFFERYGTNRACELDSIPPETLESILTASIDSVIDVELFNGEVEQEGRDAAEAQALRQTILAAIGTKYTS